MTLQRQPILFAAALVALLGSIVALIATTDERDFNLRGYADATQPGELPFRIPRLGVNAELTQYSADVMNHHLQQMREANIIWVRQSFRWDEIEPTAGEYAWDKWDALVQAFENDPQLRLVAVLINTPAWARPSSEPDAITSPPEDPAVFARFAAAFAARYSSAIDHYQIWDEPNLNAMWGGRDPRPVEYAALLQAAYSAIHATDPTSTVIAAALAPTVEAGPRNISDWRYLTDLYTFGAAAFMDAVAAKPYGFDDSPDDRTVREDTLNFSRIVALREIMVTNGDGAKLLWASHWGWNSLPDGWDGEPSIWGQVDSAAQITYTLNALERAEREWPWMGGMILQHWQPAAPADDPGWGFSLHNPDSTPTPLFEALKNQPAELYATNGRFPAANPYAAYSGVWTFGQLGADIGWLKDSHLAFNFFGRDVALLLRKDNYVGYLYPTIDESAAQTNALPRDAAGNPYIVLTSGSLNPELAVVPVARGLDDNTHTLQAVADRGFDRWALAGYAVSAGDLSVPYQRQIMLAAFTSLAAFIAVIVTGARIHWREALENGVLQRLTFVWNRINDAGQIIISIVTSLALMLGMLLTWGDSIPHILRRDSVQIALSLLTAGLVYLNPGFILTVASAVVLFWVIYQRLALGLMLVVLFAPFFLFPVELYSFAFPMVEVVTLLTFTAWLLHLIVRWGRDRQAGANIVPLVLGHPKALDWAMLAWVVLGILSLLWAAWRGVAITELRVLIIEPALFYLIFRTTALNRADVIRLVDALLAAGFLVAAIGLFQYVRGEAVITAEGAARRLASVYGSPNNVALFLGRCLPFALAFVLTNVDLIRRRIATALVVLFLITIILTQSVGGLLIGVPISVAAVLYGRFGRRSIIPILGLAVLAMLAFVVGINVSERFARALDFSQGTNLYRIRVWQSAITILQDHPITGLGLDQFLYAFRGIYIYPDAWQDPHLSHPHNILLDFWIRLGLGGVSLLVAFQWWFWQSIASGKALSDNQPEKQVIFTAIRLGILGSMVNLLAHGLIDNSVFVLDLVYVFVLLLTLAMFLRHRLFS